MKVSTLAVDPFTDMPIVILKDAEGRQAIPIWVGLIEASAIATELENIRLDRPMTHDLMKSMLDRCGVKVDHVEVHDLRANTFYAKIHLLTECGHTVTLDCRPSDAIALALRTGAGIRVARKVIDKARRIDLLSSEPLDLRRADAVSDEAPAEPDEDDFAAMLAGLSDSAFGKWKM